MTAKLQRPPRTTDGEALRRYQKQANDVGVVNCNGHTVVRQEQKYHADKNDLSTPNPKGFNLPAARAASESSCLLLRAAGSGLTAPK
jgi:hypothetical protein